MPNDSASLQLLSPKEVAALLSVTPRTVRAMAERGDLPKVKLSPRATRYRLADIERLIEQRAFTPSASA